MSFNSRRLALSLLLVCVLACAAAAASSAVVASPPAGKEMWTSVRSKHFFLVGNASDKEIRAVALRLEQFRDGFSRIFNKARYDFDVPTTVVVFKNEKAFNPFRDRKDTAGYFQPGPDINYIALSSERNNNADDPFHVIFHEYTHLLVNGNMRNVPTWFNEGLAEYYSTFEVSGGDRKVFLGNLIPNHVLLLRQTGMMPLRQLFAVDGRSLNERATDKRGIFYAQSWALIHYLTMGKDGARRSMFVKYFAALGAGKSAEASFTESFGVTIEEMEKELRNYIRSANYQMQVATFDERLVFDQTMTSEPVSEASAQAYLGDLLVHTSRLADAEPYLQNALALDPKLPLAHAALGMLRVRQNRFDDAKKNLEQAVAADTNNHLVHYYYAFALSREGMDASNFIAGYPEELAAKMRLHLRRAIELAPSFVESYDLLGFINLVTNEELLQTVTMLRRALALAPGREDLRFLLAQVYMRQEAFPIARSLLTQIARGSADAQLRAQAEQVLNVLKQREEFATQSRAAANSMLRPRTNDEREANVTTSAGTASNESGGTSVTVRPVLPKRTDGEQVRGQLLRIECLKNGVVLHIKSGERTLSFFSPEVERVEFKTYTPEMSGQFGCGAFKTPAGVTSVLTYKPITDKASAKSTYDGQVIAVEFVPNEYLN